MAAGIGRGMPFGHGAGLVQPTTERSVSNGHTSNRPAENGNVPNGAMSDAEEEKAMNNWNPMKDDYKDKKFNSYSHGPGKNLPQDRHAPRLPGREQREGTNAIKLYVSGIPSDLTEEGLENLFARAGKVVDAVKCRPKKEDCDFTFGFVSMSSVREANEAIRLLHNRHVGKRYLRVSIALSRKEKEKQEREKQEEQEFLDDLPSNRKKKEDMDNRNLPAIDINDLNSNNLQG